MNSIAIYMEGGGDKAYSKAMLRTGMDAFLAEIKNAYRAKGWHWKLVACGSRNEAYQGFRNGNADILVLLVDSEDPVSSTPTDHLKMRDGWNLNGVNDDYIHLMVQAMEAWIIADQDALATYYGQDFRKNALPRRQNLEKVTKIEIKKALDRATEKTQKGKYHKIQHARYLLQRIDSIIVRKHCPHCKRLFTILPGLIS